MVPVGQHRAADAGRSSGSRDRALRQGRKGIKHAGHEHIARRTAQRVQMEVSMAGRHA
jgi:hypothetical protein